jgi:chitodextrinase
VYVNGAGVQTRPQPGATVTGLSCGTAYTLAVDAYDLAGNRSGKTPVVATTSPCADTQAPSTPANVAVTSRTATSIALSWSASSDNVGVVAYGLYQGASSAGTTAVTTGIFSNLPCGSTFTLAVDSADAAGNRSGKATTTASTTACPDTTPPSAPTGLSASNVSGTGLTLGWNASTDNVGVTGYDVYRNGTKMASVTGPGSSQTGLACGTSYAFAVASYDGAGNHSPQTQLTASTAACAAPPPPPPPPPSPPPAPPSGASLYVSPSGSDASSCTQSAPCASFARVATVASSGSTIEVLAGSYGAQFFAGGANASQGDVNKTLTFHGQPGNKVRQIHFGSGNFTFDNIQVDADMAQTTGAAFENGGASFTFKNGRIAEVTNNKAALITGPGAVFDNVVFEDVVATSSDVHNECIQSLWTDNFTIRNSTFQDCATMDASIGYPNYWSPLPPPWYGLVLENNKFYCPRYTNNTGCHAYGLALWSNQASGDQGPFGVMKNFKIRNNWFESGGINRMSSDGSTVACGSTGPGASSWPSSWRAAC